MYGYYLWSTLDGWNKKDEDKNAAKEAAASGKKVKLTPCQPGYWRQSITTMQMTQFTCMFIQVSRLSRFALLWIRSTTFWLTFDGMMIIGMFQCYCGYPRLPSFLGLGLILLHVCIITIIIYPTLCYMNVMIMLR
jgi:hypothetical protein